MPAVPLTRAEARRRAELLSEIAYDVELDLAGDDTTFSSRTVINFSCAEPGASTFVDLDAVGVRAVLLNGRRLDDAAVRPHRIHLDRLEAHNELEVVATCAYQHTGVGLHRFVDPVDGLVYLHTQFEPFDAHRVYACFDQPDLKAPFVVAARVPAGWEAISNAVVVHRPDDGEAGWWRFAPTLPVPTYITALVAGPFHGVHDTHGDIRMGLYCRASLARYLDAEDLFALTRQGFDFFSEVFDHPYPFGKYDQLFVPEFNWGAMENAGCVTFSESYVFRSKVTDVAYQGRASTVLHEMAHMWFGNLVTMRWWDDLWLNESFATYIGNLALAEATRFDNAWTSFAQGTKAWALRQDQLPTTHPIVADMVDTDAVRTNFDGITYAKGAAVLRQLVAWVGRDAFFAGLRDYFRRHEYGNAELGDFLAALEKASGRELSDWSRQWLETAGVTTVAAEHSSANGRYTDVALTQRATQQHPTLRSHRIAVGLYDLRDGALERRRRVDLDLVGARAPVPELSGEPLADLLLINDDDLTFAKVRLDERSLATLGDHLGAVRGDLPRALCWGAAWDMTRDAELPARRFVHLVAAHAAGEPEIGVLQTLLTQARAATDRFGHPAHRTASRARLSRAARAALADADPGSDFQLVWAQARASLADDAEEQAWVRGLLDGPAVVDGLHVDTDLRWHLVGALVSAGAAGEDLIAAEQRRDPTDMGLRRAAAARASRPTAEAKAAAWDALLGDRSPSLAEIRAVLGGFQRPSQDEVLGPYIDRYVEVLPDIWAQRSPDEALVLTQGLYPVVVDERVVDAADRALADPRLPAPGRRLVLEARDGTLRALRAREADRADPDALRAAEGQVDLR